MPSHIPSLGFDVRTPRNFGELAERVAKNATVVPATPQGSTEEMDGERTECSLVVSGESPRQRGSEPRQIPVTELLTR